MKTQIQQKPFASLADGRVVHEWVLLGRKGLRLHALEWGATVKELHVPKSDGSSVDVVLGFSNLDDYLKRSPYFGAVAGRVAGRIPRGKFELEGEAICLDCNDPPNHLHGGFEGLDKQLWKGHTVERADGAPSVRFTRSSPDGESRYPGHLELSVTYTVTDANAVLIETEAISDRTTPVNLTYHSYFNLAGEGKGDTLDHRVMIAADQFVPCDEDMTPLGRLETVEGQANDLRTEKRIGDFVEQINQTHGDLYHLNPSAAAGKTPAARLSHPTSGLTLAVSSDHAYLQLYCAVHLNGGLKGKSGGTYPSFGGVCLEVEGYPDAVNHPELDDILVHPNKPQRRWAKYQFTYESKPEAINQTQTKR